MDLHELKAAALAARQFQVSIGECSFTLRTPTRLELREVLRRHAVEPDSRSAVVMALVQHYLLLGFLVAWTGPREGDIVPGAGNAPLPWSADAVPLLLDAQPEWADTLGGALMGAIAERSLRIEADAKN